MNRMILCCAIVLALGATAASGAAKTSAPKLAWTLENEVLCVRVEGQNLALSVQDKRTGRLWKSSAAEKKECRYLRYVSTIAAERDRLVFAAVDTRTQDSREIAYRLDPSAADEFTLEIAGSGALEEKQYFFYPDAFKPVKGDMLIAPYSVGFRLPFLEKTMGVGMAFFNSSGCMPFFGIEEDGRGSGLQVIFETSNDARACMFSSKEGTLNGVAIRWDPELGRFGYTRRLRFVLFEKGGYVAQAKRYRKAAQAEGLVKTFREKVKTRPNVDRLLGAVNVWYYATWRDPSSMAMAQEMKACGIDRMLWSTTRNPDEVKDLVKLPDMLVGRYDCYRDVYYPEMMKACGMRKDPSNEICRNTSAYPDDINWKSPKTNDFRTAWDIKDKAGNQWFSYAQCTSCQAKRLRRNVKWELPIRPYNTRFIDVLGGAFEDCWNPAHPMTRTQGRAAQTEVLKVLTDEFGLVVGSEQGMGCIVPVCDYFEGMNSPWSYRIPYRDVKGGRAAIFRDGLWPTNVPPEAIAKVVDFSLNPKYRIPLYDLVFHDCCCAHWYWYDYSNRPLALWTRRDLFNILYGDAQMFIFDYQHWTEHKDEFIASYKRVAPTVRKVGYEELLSHEALTSDRLVQRSVFADGTVVTVNFGPTPWTDESGAVLAPESSRVTENR